MKHYYLLSIAVLLLTGSCRKHIERPINPTFSIDLIKEEVPPGHTFYANVPVEFALQIKHPSTSPTNIQAYASLQAGEGEIIINGEKSNDTIIHIENGSTPISYFPLSLGEHRLQFRLFTDEGYTAEAVYALSVPEYSISIVPDDIEIIYAGETADIGFHIYERGNMQGHKLQADLAISKGDGEASMPAPAIPNQKEGSYQITTGKNVIRYLPHYQGEHIVRIRFTNSYGYQQFFNLTLYAFPASIKNDIEF